MKWYSDYQWGQDKIQSNIVVSFLMIFKTLFLDKGPAITLPGPWPLVQNQSRDENRELNISYRLAFVSLRIIFQYVKKRKRGAWLFRKESPFNSLGVKAYTDLDGFTYSFLVFLFFWQEPWRRASRKVLFLFFVFSSDTEISSSI